MSETIIANHAGHFQIKQLRADNAALFEENFKLGQDNVNMNAERRRILDHNEELREGLVEANHTVFEMAVQAERMADLISDYRELAGDMATKIEQQAAVIEKGSALVDELAEALTNRDGHAFPVKYLAGIDWDSLVEDPMLGSVAPEDESIPFELIEMDLSPFIEAIEQDVWSMVKSVSFSLDGHAMDPKVVALYLGLDLDPESHIERGTD